jgi:serine/threonine protein kinase
MITNRKGDVSEDFCRYVCYTTLKGLDYLHSKNIMHRDIKSENIMISPRFDLKLCGFQFAEKLSKNREKRNKRVGTVDWMSPEMLNYKEYNITVDVWSFGILVFELTTGAPPYVDENRYTVIEKIISEPAPKLIDYSKKWSHDFCHFLSRCLQKDPQYRWSPKKLLSHEWLKNAEKCKPAFEKEFTAWLNLQTK